MKLASGYDRKKFKELREYRHLTEEEILNLSHSHVDMISMSGVVRTVKINGNIRTWKRDKERVEIPCKYGMYEFFTLNLKEALEKFVKLVERRIQH